MPAANKSRDVFVAVMQLTLAMILSGGIGISVKQSEQTSVFNVVFFRCLISFVILILDLFIINKCTYKMRFSRQELLSTISGLLLVVNWVLLFYAFKFTSISEATILYHTYPFTIIILGALFMRQKIKFIDVIWTTLSFSGVILIAVRTNQDTYSVGNHNFYGITLTLIATILYSFSIIFAKEATSIPPKIMLLLQMGVGCIISLPFVRWENVYLGNSGFFYLFFLGVMQTYILYSLVYISYKQLNIPTITILSFIYPISAILLDHVYYGTGLSFDQMLGSSIILIAILGSKLNIIERFLNIYLNYQVK